MTSASVAHSVGAPLTDRRATTFDKELELRLDTAAAVTTTTGSYASPDWSNATAISLGNGKFVGRVVLYDFAPTFNADNTMKFVVQGINGTDTAVLAEKQIAGAAANWAGDAAVTDAKYTTGDLDLYFCNVAFGVRYPDVKLLLINGGTASGFTSGTFGAFIARLM